MLQKLCKIKKLNIYEKNLSLKGKVFKRMFFINKDWEMTYIKRDI